MVTPAADLQCVIRVLGTVQKGEQKFAGLVTAWTQLSRRRTQWIEGLIRAVKSALLALTEAFLQQADGDGQNAQSLSELIMCYACRRPRAVVVPRQSETVV